MEKTSKDSILRLLKRAMPGCLWLAAALGLTSCGQQNGGYENRHLADETEAEITQDIQCEIVDGVQFAKGYGIFSAGEAPAYILKEEPSAIETEGARAWLMSAVYHEGFLRFVVKVEDYSITEIPQNELEDLLKKEKENHALQEKGDAADWDFSYFPIDEEQGIYGRSSFESRAEFRKTEEGDRGEHFRKSIEGAGIPGGRFSPNRSGNTRDNREYLEKGYVTTYCWYESDRLKLEIPEPKGRYKIYIPGFADGFSMEFVKAASYPRAEDIPGMVMKDGVGILTAGQREEDELRISNYIWSDGTYTMTPVISSLTCRMKGSTAEGEMKIHYNLNRLGMPEEFSDTLGGIQGHTLLYEIPEKFENGEFIMEFGEVTLTSRKQTEWLVIPIPEEKTPLDKMVEFEDCTIRIISAQKAAPRVYGNINGVEDVRPSVYLEVEVTMRDTGKSFKSVTVAQEELNPENSFHGRWAELVYTKGRPTGIYAYYEEGDEELNLRFENPSYIWHKEFTVPVQMEEP